MYVVGHGVAALLRLIQDGGCCAGSKERRGYMQERGPKKRRVARVLIYGFLLVFTLGLAQASDKANVACDGTGGCGVGAEGART